MARKILILCTGNCARSQMAKGFLQKIDPSLKVFSAGSIPSMEVHPLAIQVMKEKNIDISGATPRSVQDFLHMDFDFLITVCDDVNADCPRFIGQVKKRIHYSFEDPVKVKGSEKEKLCKFRYVAEHIERAISYFYQTEIAKILV